MRLTLVAALSFSTTQSQVIDRTVAIVGDQAITSSQVALQVRLEAMANGVVYVDSSELREDALARLIDQRLVVNDLRLTGLPSMTDEERSETLDQLRVQHFGDLTFDEALQRYNLTGREVLDFFVLQVEFSRYVDFRFRTGQIVSDEALNELYTSKYGRTPSRDAPPLSAVRAALRAELLNAMVERQLDQHIRQLRADNRVVRLGTIDRSAAAQEDSR